MYGYINTLNVLHFLVLFEIHNEERYSKNMVEIKLMLPDWGEK